MTWSSFRRDLKYMVVNGGAAGLLKVVFAWLAIDLELMEYGPGFGYAYLGRVAVLVLVYEFSSIGTTA